MQIESIIGRYIRIINSEEEIIWNEFYEIIRKIFSFYQSGYHFSSFNEAFFYWIAILLVIFTHKNLEDIRLTKKENISSDIPKYSIILDVCPAEVIVHFLRLRRKIWKDSTFIFAGSISGLCLTLQSLIKIVSIQLKLMKLSLEDLELVRCSSFMIINLSSSQMKSFDKTSEILFRKYQKEDKLSEESLKQKEQEVHSELIQDLYDVPSDLNLVEMINGFTRLELLNWWRRNILNNSSKKDF
jgi:hypothetical protein